MKYRVGFVSNSSTTSFAMVGVYGEVTNSRDMWGVGKDKLIHFYHQPYNDDDYYIGVSFEDMKDDETKAQFYDRVQTILNPFLDAVGFKGERVVGLQCDGWYDG